MLGTLPQRIGGVRRGSEGLVYFVGPAGARLLALRDGRHVKRLVAPGERFVRHTLAITEIYVGLHEAEHQKALQLHALETEPTCWRAFTGPMGATVTLRPDLFVALAAGAEDEDRWFLELDLATEGRGSILRKLARYRHHFYSGLEQHRHGVYPRTVWSVPDVKRASWLHDILERQGQTDKQLHVVTTHDALVPFLASEARA